jgi:hypothetical protein
MNLSLPEEIQNFGQKGMENDLKKLEALIFEVRGCQVILDRDLAALYGVETKALNQAVKRNIERFPEDFMFKLTKDECLRSQIVTLNTTQGKHMKYMPYAFTENGVAMLSSVLRSSTAIVDDTVYHIGASLKDLGKKLFAFSRMTIPAQMVL